MLALHERESVAAEKATETIREGVSLKQAAEEGNAGLLPARKHAEQEVFMFVQALLP
jgi:hypothetical protein